MFPQSLPPDPQHVAQALPDTGISSFAEATRFLYTAPQPIQTGVAPGAISEGCAAVLRGKVTDRASKPLVGVRVSVLHHAEYGSTTTRTDGMFDLAVNGGTTLTVQYAGAGMIPIQRAVRVPWQDYVWLPDAVLIAYDTKATRIDLSAMTFQVAQGSTVADGEGARTATVLFPPGTTAVASFSGGSVRSLATNAPMTVRATEYTVGGSGPSAMPGTLPGQSGYTYAVELSVDEATAAGAVDVSFNKPVFFYVENFLNFPVGGAVPMGYYDRVKGAWVPSQNGRVIKVVGISGGLADLDLDGDGAADGAAALSALGITDGERTQLASRYQVGQSLWRVPITHFTPWDCNWPWSAPEGARAPEQPRAQGDSPLDKPCRRPGSIIECQNQVLGEELGVTGTPFNLSYRSNRVPGRTAANTLTIPLSGDSVPASLKRIELELQVAGQLITRQFPAAPNQSFSYTWDGKDGYGRTVQGRQAANIRIGYVYDAVYQRPADFQRSFAAFSGVPITGNRARQEITLWQEQRAGVGTWDARGLGLGGWSLSVQHAYDPIGRVLFRGDGSRRSADGQIVQQIETVAGNGNSLASGDGDRATSAGMSPVAVAVAPDGSLYIVGNSLVRRVDANGVIQRVAGGGSPPSASVGDGGPATQADLFSAVSIAFAPDGSYYVAQRFSSRVRRISPSGIIETVAGTGTSGFSGDGGPATQARLNQPYGLAVAPDSTLYIADRANNRVRRVGTDGIITTVAGDGGGTGASGCSVSTISCGDGGPAAQAQIPTPGGIAVGPDGSLYISTSGPGRVRRLGTDGIITSVANVSYIWQG